MTKKTTTQSIKSNGKAVPVSGQRDRIILSVLVVLALVLVVGLVAANASLKPTASPTPTADTVEPSEIRINPIVPVNVRKPIIYLYPPETTSVEVKLGYPEKVTTVYPEYDDGWRVIAEPDGTLHDEARDRDYYALYWEGEAKNIAMTDGEGFIVAREDLDSFLEEKLAWLGLNDREAEEFIVYWLPVLRENEYTLISFATREEIETVMPLSISPQPDTVIRILMKYRPASKDEVIIEQQLPAANQRTGFTVVEWGGSEII